jgi:hypothetical protein
VALACLTQLIETLWPRLLVALSETINVTLQTAPAFLGGTSRLCDT